MSRLNFAQRLAAAQPTFAQRLVAEMLATPAVDQAAILRLACREHFAEAAKLLMREIRPHSNNLVGVLFQPPTPDFLPQRVATQIGVITWSIRRTLPLTLTTIADLRRYTTQKNASRAARARVALAILGEPVAPWHKISRRERAGILLSQLVAAFRERAE
jgi:hypothetical protein